MNKRFWAGCTVLVFAGTWSVLAATDSKTKTWKGYVTDTQCGLSRATKPPSVECTTSCVREKGAKYALYDVENKKLYVLNPQDEAAKYSAQMVTVTGTVGEDTPITNTEGTIQRSTIIASSISVVPPQVK